MKILNTSPIRYTRNRGILFTGTDVQDPLRYREISVQSKKILRSLDGQVPAPARRCAPSVVPRSAQAGQCAGASRFRKSHPQRVTGGASPESKDIDSGLNALVAEVRSRGISSIAIPPLGAGLGGLDWADVRVRIEGAIQNLPDVQTIVFEPHDAPGQVEPATASGAPGRQQTPSNKPFIPAGNSNGIEAQAS